MGLSTAAEVNDYMKTRSYVEGYAFSAKDVEVFGKIGLPDQKQHPQGVPLVRPHGGPVRLQVPRVGGGRRGIETDARAGEGRRAQKAAPAKPAPKAEEEEDDDDFWGDDEEQTEEEKAQAAKELEEAKAKAMAKLAKKEANQRSLCNLEIKPWEADQDLKALYMQRTKKTVVKDGAQVVGGFEIGRRRVWSPENHPPPPAVVNQTRPWTRSSRRSRRIYSRTRSSPPAADVDVAALGGGVTFLRCAFFQRRSLRPEDRLASTAWRGGIWRAVRGPARPRVRLASQGLGGRRDAAAAARRRPLDPPRPRASGS